MIAVLGIKRNTPIEIREKLTIKVNKHDEYLDKLLKYLEGLSFLQLVIEQKFILMFLL